MINISSSPKGAKRDPKSLLGDNWPVSRVKRALQVVTRQLWFPGKQPCKER